MSIFAINHIFVFTKKGKNGRIRNTKIRKNSKGEIGNGETFKQKIACAMSVIFYDSIFDVAN